MTYVPPPRGGGARQRMEDRLKKERVQEEKTSALNKYLFDQQVCEGHTRSSNHVEALRLRRYKNEESAEIERREAEEMQHRLEVARAAREEQEDETGENARQKEENVAKRKEMEKALVCANSDELKQLKQQIDIARMNKERAVQLLDQHLRHEEDRLHESLLEQKMEENRANAEKREFLLLEEREKGKVEMRRMQQAQLEERQRELARQAEIYEKERQEILTVIKVIQEEEDNAKMQIAKKKLQQQNEFAQADKLRSQFKLDEKMRAEEEERKITEYINFRDSREDALEQEMKKKAESKRAILNQLANEHLQRKNEEDEIQELLNELHAEEREQREREKEELEEQKKEEHRRTMLAAYEEYMQLKQERLRMQKEEEEAFRIKMLQKMAEDDELDRLSFIKRKQKLEQHKSAVEQMMAEKRRLYELEIEKEITEQQKLAVEEYQRDLLIQEEKERLLALLEKEKLNKFLPKKI